MAAKPSLIVTHVARVILGLVFFVFGLLALSGLLTPPPHKPAADAFGAALAATGYLFLWIKLTEIAAGALLLANRYVPLALVVLAPIVLNIYAFHAVLDRDPLSVVPVVLLVGEIWLAWAYRDNFRSVLVARARPTVG